MPKPVNTPKVRLINTPKVHLGVVGVSRDCFPISLTRKRLTKLMSALKRQGVDAERCAVVIESENDSLKADSSPPSAPGRSLTTESIRTMAAVSPPDNT